MSATSGLIHEILPVGWLHCNCSILGDPETHEAIVVDPGDEVERVLEALAQHSLRVKYIVITHAHIDHVGGLARLKEATGALVLMHPEDHWLYQNVALQAAMIGMPAPAVTEVDQPLRPGETLRWGKALAAEMKRRGHKVEISGDFAPPGCLAFNLKLKCWSAVS